LAKQLKAIALGKTNKCKDIIKALEKFSQHFFLHVKKPFEGEKR